MTIPLLTTKVCTQIDKARQRGETHVQVSLDLDKSVTEIELAEAHWSWQGHDYPYLKKCKERTIYYWCDDAFEPVARYTNALIKLVATEWGPPTFEIDGIKMLPTAQVSPYDDAQRKVDLIEPRGKVVLDTCGGLGYFAAWCLQRGAARIISFEKNPDVVWLRSLNPWSPTVNDIFTLTQGDISQLIGDISDDSVDAILHDPPRFGIAGELYSQIFYNHLARVLRRGGRLFHYTGSPNKLTTGRDVPNEVAKRLRTAGFRTELIGDGVLAVL